MNDTMTPEQKEQLEYNQAKAEYQNRWQAWLDQPSPATANALDKAKLAAEASLPKERGGG